MESIKSILEKLKTTNEFKVDKIEGIVAGNIRKDGGPTWQRKRFPISDPEDKNCKIFVNLWNEASLLIDDTLEKGDKITIENARAEVFVTTNNEKYEMINSVKTTKIQIEYKRKRILVDGSNVAYLITDGVGVDGKPIPTLESIEKVIKELENKGYFPIVFVDANLRHKIPEREKKKFEEYLKKYKLQQIPRAKADEFLLEIAYKRDFKIVTNDNFKEYRNEYQNIDDKIISCHIIQGINEIQFIYKGKIWSG